MGGFDGTACGNTGITAKNLNLLIERIEVLDRTETDGETQQAIRICYRFGGYIGEHRFKAKVS